MTKEYTFYRIFNLNLEECYVGSTTNYNQRIAGHKSICNNPNELRYNTKVYKFIRENGGFKNWQFEIIDIQNLIKKEASNIENEYRMIYGATLNNNVPGRTDNESKQQYKLKNKEKISEQDKQYKLKNKDKIKEQRKQYYLDNKDKFNA